MSKDNVSGIVLDIPKEVLDNIKDADKYIKQLEATSRQAAQKIKGHFDNTMVSGVNVFIKKVKEAQSKLGNLKMPTIDASGLSSAIQELSKAMATIDKSATTGSNRLTRIANAMTALQTANPNPQLFQTIADGIAKIGNTSQQTIDNVRNLSQIMAQLARDIRTVQAAQSAQNANTATAAQYNKLYKEQANILRDIINLQQKPTKTAEEVALLSQLKKRYNEIGSAISELNKKQQTAASSLAQQQGVLRRELERGITAPKGAIDYAKNAKSLNELQAAYKNLKAVMATTKPDTKEWTQMNATLEKTRNRIDEIRKKMGEFKSQASQVGDIAGQLARTLAATFSVSAITGYINKMIQVRAQFELQQTALRAILQNKDEADRIFMQVQQLALQSPFSIMQMTSYTKQLAAYRIESEKLVDTTKMLADVSAGLGVDMGRLILAYGQVKAANYLRATEVRQFTEAGLNIAGELANYFSELQGKMISVGDVMDMITKRMVRFEDVEEVFKRVTSAGGLFYDMQKKQSETLWGQLQRIKDAMSIMFNEIGKSNQSAISGALTLIRSLLANWKVFANILNGAGVAMVAYTIKTVAAAVATNTFNASQKGLVGALARSKAALLAFTKFLSANPYILAITGVVALGSALLDWKEKVDSAREAYDNMIVGISERESKLTSIADKVADTNKRITESQQAMKKNKVGTNEYTDAVEANKQAMLEQNRALQELRNNFPEVYQQMVQTKDGVVDLTEAIKAFAEAADAQRVIATMQKSRTGYFNEDLKKDLEDFSKAQNEYDAQLKKAEAYLNTYFAKAKAVYATREAEGKLSDKDIAKFERILSIKESELSVEEKIRKVIATGFRGRDNFISELKGDVADLERTYRLIGQGKNAALTHLLESSTKEVTKEIHNLLDDALMEAGVTTPKMFEGLEDGAKKSTEIALNGFIKNLGASLDEAQREIIEANLFAPLKITPFWDLKEVEPQMSFLQGKINSYIEEHNIGSIAAKIQVTDNTDSYFDGLTKQWRAKKDEIEQLERATTQIAKAGNKARIAELEVEKKALEDMFKAFGIEWRTKQEINGGRQKDIWTPRLNLMQKVNKEYEKLLKYYAKEDAMAKIRSSYGDAVAEAFKGTQWADISKWGTFDAQATVDRLKKLAEVAGKDAKKKILEAAGTIEAEIEIKVKESEIQKAKDELQKNFDNYELTKTLGNLGLNVDLTYMVGGRPMTLPQIRKDIEDKLKVAKATDGQEEFVKTYEDYLRKVADMENKAAVERLKNYNKYLLESMSERVQIELKAQQEIRKIRQDETLDDFSKNQAVEQAKKKMQEDLTKFDFDQFKSSDVYLDTFKDLEKASKEQLQYVIDRLKELQSATKDLSPIQVKSIAQEIKKAQDALGERTSFTDIGKNLTESIKYAKQRSALISQQVALQKQLTAEEKRLSEEEKKLYNITQDRDAIQNKESDAWQLMNAEVEKQQQTVADIQKGVEGISTALDGVTEKISKGEQAWANFRGAISKTRDAIGQANEAVGSIFEGMDSMGLISDSMRDGFESVSEIIGGIDKTLAGLESIDITKPFSVVTGIGKTIGGVFSTIGGIFGLGDKKKERQIKRLQEKVENLQKAYEKLGVAIEEAYSYDDYNMAYDQSMKNLEAQRQAIQEQMALEKAKKKTDKDRLKEYEDALEELTEREKQLRDERYEAMGSVSDKGVLSEAENFVSVWLDAYKETGNGLDALNEHWDEFFENLVLKQASSAVVSKRLASYVDQINAAIDSGDTGLSLSQTFAQIGQNLKNELGIWNEDLKAFFDAVGIKGGAGSLLLSDLQKGISNITEPQAAAIESYLNSMRFAVFEQNNILTQMLTAIQAQYGSSTDNPILSEVKAIRSLVASIDDRLSRVIVPKNSVMSSYVMKVN